MVCTRFCPKKDYLYCWVCVYNATDKILLITPKTKLAEGEAIFVDEELTKTVNYAIDKCRPKTEKQSKKDRTTNEKIKKSKPTKRVRFETQDNTMKDTKATDKTKIELPPGEIIPDGN